MTELKIQFFSDVHTECYSGKEAKFLKLTKKIQPIGDILILAGDIGRVDHIYYRRFLQIISQKFQGKHVFLISGNHEYYHGESSDSYKDYIDHVHNNIRKIVSEFTNIIFLQNEIFDIPETDICVFGSTMWSDIFPNQEDFISKHVRDYEYIPEFTTKKCRELNKFAVESLVNVLKLNYNKKFLIVTHHLPSFDLIETSKRFDSFYQNFNSAYATKIDSTIVQNHNILKWFAGHTHYAQDMEKFHVNPIGYPGENSKQDFNKIVLVKY